MGNEQRGGVGKNKPQQTAEYIGGGALQGAIIRVIAGGGKSAAISATAGTGVGVGKPVLTRGKKVNVPAVSLLKFRLEKSLPVGVANNGITRNGRHYQKTNRWFSIRSSVARSLAKQDCAGWVWTETMTRGARTA